MHLSDWLSQRWPDGDLPIDVVIAIGSGVARSLAEAWDRPEARVHGALCIEALRVDADGTVAIVGATESGDRIAHQRDLQSAGRLLYGLVMDEAPEETADPKADRVAAVLQSIRTSSLQRARARIRAVHPVVGAVIARMLETSDEHGFTDGWAVAEAFDHLSVLPTSDVLAPGMPPLFPEEDDPSDSTMFVELYRSGDDLQRAEPVRSAAPRASTPPLPTPAPSAVAPVPRPRAAGLRAAPLRGLGSVAMCVAAMWFIGLAMGCAALWHKRCQTSAAPLITLPSIPVIADIDEGDTGDFEVPEREERLVVRDVVSDRPVNVSERPVNVPGQRRDRLSITLSDSIMAHSLELSCPGGYRNRVPVRAGPVVFTGVPIEACMLSFKGPIPARFQPVNGGKSLRCSVVGTTAVCT